MRSSSLVTRAVTVFGVGTTCSIPRFYSSSGKAQCVAEDATSSTTKHYDCVVLGAGSGGIAFAKRAASYGATVAIVEGNKYGGTCVNVGCVPKKIMFNASSVAEAIKESHQFGFKGISEKDVEFDWNAMKKYRDRYIGRLNTIYEDGLEKLKVHMLNGMGKFTSPNTIVVGEGDNARVITGKHIVIAVGGAPSKLGVPGEEWVIDSDGFFALEQQPKKVGIIGAGYIAVELAGVFNGLGSETSLFVRGDKALRQFDTMVSTHLDACLKKSGVDVVTYAAVDKVVKETNGTLTLHLKSGKSYGGFDCLLAATGRRPLPLTAPLNLPGAGVSLSATGSVDDGYIAVDEYQNTNVAGVYALGDVCGRVELTPMAIAAGRRLADRLFGNKPDAKADYDNVATVVFSHPTIGTVGLTEQEAVAKYGSSQLKIYTSSFVNLWYGPYYKGGPGDKPVTKYKLICEGERERVVGIHLIGMASDEVIQGFAVAMKMGAVKSDFDACVAIHPTAAEELVTLPPWGLAPPSTNNRG